MSTTMATGLKTCRILYYGPVGCGKRENLAQIQSSLPAEHRLAVATNDPSRQIAFMLRNGNQGDWQVFVQALDSGQEMPAVSGENLPFDGVVFVCDSGVGALDNGLSSMENLKSYLDCYHQDIMSMPMVLQYNRRKSEGVLPVDRLESLLNPWGLLSFPAASGEGEGVRETLKAVLSLTLSHILQREAASPRQESTSLEIDTNPPVPGTDHTPGWSNQQQAAPAPAPAAAPEAPRPSSGIGKPSLVIPVRVPRSALGPDGKGRIILEVQIEDD